MFVQRKGGRRRVAIPINSLKKTCPQKKDLLYEYLRTVDVLNNLTREYSETLKHASGPEMLEPIKARIVIAQTECRDARQRCADHKREHGC